MPTLADPRDINTSAASPSIVPVGLCTPAKDSEEPARDLFSSAFGANVSSLEEADIDSAATGLDFSISTFVANPYGHCFKVHHSIPWYYSVAVTEIAYKMETSEIRCEEERDRTQHTGKVSGMECKASPHRQPAPPTTSARKEVQACADESAARCTYALPNGFCTWGAEM